MNKAFLTLFNLFLLIPLHCFAQEDYSPEFDEYSVHYSVFSSTSINAEVAQRYGLVRGEDRVYINIAVVPKDREFGGIKAKVSGTATNLIQQQKSLEFREIEEPNAIYYLAPLRHTEREVFHFLINIDPQGPGGPYQLKFTKELYVNP